MNPYKRKQTTRRGSRRRPAVNKNLLPSADIRPSQFESNVRFIHKYRFLATSAFNNGLLDSNFVGIVGTIGTVVVTTVSTMAACVRIRKLEMWAAPASQGAAATCSVDWFGSGNTPNLEISDTTLSVSRNAYVNSKPPRNSLASFWQKASGNVLCTLICPADTIIDVTMDVVLADGDAEPSAVNGFANVVLGRAYYLALDRTAGPTTNDLVPVGVTTVT